MILGHRGMLGSELFGRLSPPHNVAGKDADEFCRVRRLLPAQRPRNSVLDCTRFVEARGKTMRFWQLALQEYMVRERMTGGN